MTSPDNDNDNDDFLTRIEIAVDGETRRRLIAVANEAHSSPKMIAAALLRAVLEDDALAHECEELDEQSNVVDLSPYLH